MMNDQRKHPRTKLALPVKLTFDSGRSIEVKTWDISDGGIGINHADHTSIVWAIGMTLKAQVQGLPIEGPIVPMTVARITDDRIGLKMHA